MALDPSIAAAVASLQAQRDKLDRAIAALIALDDDEHVAGAHKPSPQVISGAGGIAPGEAFGEPALRVEGGGAAGARRVLTAAPGQGFTARELAAAMTKNGWITPSQNRPAAARAAGNRLRDDPDEHVFFEDGKFVYRPPGDQLEGLREATQEDGGP